MVFTTGCRGRSLLPVPGALPPPVSSLTLVSAELLLSHRLTPLSAAIFTAVFFPHHKGVITEALTTIADELGLGQWRVHLGAGWHWL